MRSCLRVVALATVAFPSFAQDIAAPGFALTSAPNPAAANVLAISTTLSDGDIVIFDGIDVTQHAPDGTLTHLLGSFPEFVYPSFVVADPGESRIFVGESTNGTIQKLFLGTFSSPDLVTMLAYSFDAILPTAATLYVSAASCGLACGNEIWRVDLATNAATLVATAPGASGPIAFDDAGNLFYGTVTNVFPNPPPDASAVYRWSAAQLTGPGPLTLDDATLIGSGFAGAARFVFDHRTDWLYVMESNWATGVNRVRRVRGSAVTSPVVVEGRPFQTMGNLSLQLDTPPARFRGYQPETSGTLVYTSTDFATTAERFAVRPARPVLWLTGPGVTGPGPFTMHLTGGPPAGKASMLICALADYLPVEQVLLIDRVPLHLSLGASSLASVPGYLPLDGNGELHVDYVNPGGWEGTGAFQLVVFEHPQKFVGSSNASFL